VGADVGETAAGDAGIEGDMTGCEAAGVDELADGTGRATLVGADTVAPRAAAGATGESVGTTAAFARPTPRATPAAKVVTRLAT